MSSEVCGKKCEDLLLCGQGAHTHEHPYQKEGPKELLDKFGHGHEEFSIGWDGHHPFQFIRHEEDWKPRLSERAHDLYHKIRGDYQGMPPLEPGHIRVRFQCGDQVAMVDWPDREADAYYARFRQLPAYRWASDLPCQQLVVKKSDKKKDTMTLRQIDGTFMATAKKFWRRAPCHHPAGYCDKERLQWI
ncbi:hypothetical protein BO99DRAFT_450209 [Aspergillus violaceofuscus CBS 115571]|uniref:Uncharacterized protein n=1 Tax=Aspergillus violaceofuscus (strain CBS 115571) TaxID=1450538 RepID=A0A2V5GZ21_ASPV1|nr:hypothetical protein BO99DRAFT_450209 [Aspergillus violaceofuscus CBS 115571]